MKGKNRVFFEDRLVKNISAALAVAVPDRPPAVKNDYGRILARVPEQSLTTAIDALKRVFGLVSLSPAIRTDLKLESIKKATADTLPAVSGKLRFKVHSIRANKAFPLTSIELNEVIGDYVFQTLLEQGANREDIQVDLSCPDICVNIDVRADGAYIYTEVIPGPGGLPLGSSGSGLLLLSGGIDSPVAGWYMMKRGIALEAIHFDSFPFTSERARQKAVDLCGALSRWGMPVPLHICHFTEIQTEIGRLCPDEMITIVMRRMMFRISEKVAMRRACGALITGESVGQVASQTLESMNAIGRVARITVLRPLCGLDKLEIVRKAREIGTYEISIQPYEDCCTMFVPQNPRTKPRLDQVEAAESGLDVEGLVEGAVETLETMTCCR